MSKEQKKIALSGTFNLLSTYSIFFIGIVNTFFIARLITPYEWGILLFAITFIGVAAYFCHFLPPAAENTIQYYIPKLKSGDLSNNYEIRRFILHVYKVRFIFTIIVYIIFLVVIYLINFEGVFLQTLYIISPLIIINVIQNINSSILLAFQKFKKIFIVNFISIALWTSGNMIIFLLKLQFPLIYISGLYLLGAFFSFIVSIIFIIPLIPSKIIKAKDNIAIKKENYIQIHTKYGLLIVLSGIVANIFGMIINFLFFYFGVIVFITYLMICESFIGFALSTSGSSSRSSFTSIFSEINYEKNLKEYVSLFYQLNKYLLLSLCLIVAILFFFMEVYIRLIYSETYLIIMLAIQIFLFSSFARTLARNLLIISQSTNRTIINLKLGTCQSIFFLISTIVAILFFDFYFLIIFYLITRFINPIYLVYLINRNSEFNLKLTQLFKPFLIFLLSFFISLPFILFIDFDIGSDLFLLNLLINSILKFSVFCIFFYLIIFFTKYFTKEEFNLLVNVFPIFNTNKKFTVKIIKFIEKLFPSEKTKHL